MLWKRYSLELGPTGKWRVIRNRDKQSGVVIGEYTDRNIAKQVMEKYERHQRVS